MGLPRGIVGAFMHTQHQRQFKLWAGADCSWGRLLGSLGILRRLLTIYLVQNVNQHSTLWGGTTTSWCHQEPWRSFWSPLYQTGFCFVSAGIIRSYSFNTSRKIVFPSLSHPGFFSAQDLDTHHSAPTEVETWFSPQGHRSRPWPTHSLSQSYFTHYSNNNSPPSPTIVDTCTPWSFADLREQM